MFHPSIIINKARARGADLYTGVPCSFLKPLINYATDSPGVHYVPLNNEGEAIAFASGAYMTGKKPVVMFQNSGLGNTVNPLTSLVHPFRIPLLLICTWRGQPGIWDEPQHELMGEISARMLSLIGVENELIADAENQIEAALDRAFDRMESAGLPYGLIVPKGVIEAYEMSSRPEEKRPSLTLVRTGAQGAPSLRRFDLIRMTCDVVGTEHVIVGTTGKTGRELFVYRDSPNHLYMVGAMGCASSFALGMAMHLPPWRKVVVIDGDGAALMRLEAMASIGYYQPPNLIHVLLDNNMHESTGGQQTLSHGIALDRIAAACGYADVVSVVKGTHFENELSRALAMDGPSLIYARILPGSLDSLPRPTMKPYEVKERLMSYLGIGEKECLNPNA
jgi:phosphonopyruvate decarboxylase